MTSLSSKRPFWPIKGPRLRNQSPKTPFSLLSFSYFLLGGWALFLFSTTVRAANEVILSPIDPAGTNRPISLFSGDALPANSLVRIGTFANGGTSVADLSSFVSSWTNQATTSSFLDFLNTNFITWNSFTTTNSPWPGSGSTSVPNTNTATNLVGKPMYIWVYNTSTHAAATNAGSQMLILRSWETNSLGAGFPDKDGGSFGLDSNFNFFPSTPSGTEFPNPDPEDPLPITAYGVSVLFGQYLPDALQFRLGGVTPRAEITSSLSKTNATGAEGAYQILANNGADRFFATTNTSGMNLMETNLPNGFSVSTNTGVITVATNASAGTYAIRLVASNSLTASVATNTLTWVLQAAALSFTTTTDLISATAGVEISPFTFVSTGTTPTYSVASGDLRGLSLSSAGVLSGIPTSTGTNDVTIQASAGGQLGTSTFSLAVTAPTISVPAGALAGGQIVVTAGTATTINFSNTTSAGFTDLTGLVFPTTTGVSFNGTDLIITTNALPLLKGSNNVSLTLIARRNVAGIPVEAATTVPFRIVAPAPTALIGTNEFEVPVGEPFSVVLRSDAGSFASVSLNDRLLPPGLGHPGQGAITGINVSTNAPFQFSVPVTFNSAIFYEGGGVLTTNIVFLLRNTNAPYFSNLKRQLSAVGRPIQPVTLTASNFPFRYAATNLPPGLRLEGSAITGTPKSAGIYPVSLTAYNSFRPGSADPAFIQKGTGMMVFHVAATRPQGVVPRSPGPIRRNATIRLADNVSLLNAEAAGVRVGAHGLPPGLSLDPDTGKLFGRTGKAGTYPATVFVQNGLGWTKHPVILKVQ